MHNIQFSIHDNVVCAIVFFSSKVGLFLLILNLTLLLESSAIELLCTGKKNSLYNVFWLLLLLLRLKSELGNEIACKWICLKICWWSKTSGEAGAVSRSPRQRMDGYSSISQLTGAKVSRMGQAYSQAVSHGDSPMSSELYF